MADTEDLKSSSERSAGSIPAPGTKKYKAAFCGFYFLSRGAVGGLGCLALLALTGLRYSGSAPLARLVNPPLRVPFLPSGKNIKPAKGLLHTAQAVLHILRQRCKMLHAAEAALHLFRIFAQVLVN